MLILKAAIFSYLELHLIAVDLCFRVGMVDMTIFDDLCGHVQPILVALLVQIFVRWMLNPRSKNGIELFSSLDWVFLSN